jgi:hypothetical protein
MYTRGMLKRYADTLTDQDGERLRAQLSSIIWAPGSNDKLCVAVEAENAFQRAGLIMDSRRLLEQAIEEDFQLLSSYPLSAEGNPPAN